MRVSLPLLGFVLLGSTAFARADVIYNLTLTSTDGYAGGTGSFTLNTPPPAIGVATYVPFYVPLYVPCTCGPDTPGGLLLAFNASISVAGGNASMTLDYFQGGVVFPYIQFTDGVPSNFSGFETIVGGRNYYEFGVGVSGYDFVSSMQSSGPPTYRYDAGTVTITPAAVAATPEPSSVALVGTGLLGIAAVLTHRIRLPFLQR